MSYQLTKSSSVQQLQFHVSILTKKVNLLLFEMALVQKYPKPYSAGIAASRHG